MISRTSVERLQGWFPMQGDREVSVAEETREDTVQNKKPDKLPLFEKVLAGSCLTALGTSMASESVFAITILSVTVLMIASLFLEVWK